MKFLCDVHISIKISKRIEQIGFLSQHVNHILDRWHTKDNAIAHYADQHDLILITKDQDFRNSFLLNRKPSKLIKVNLGNVSNEDLLEVLESNMERLEVLNSQSETFMVEINKGNFWVVMK